jgi:leucyl/phenylalanyl-tRNA--protein transferase
MGRSGPHPAELEPEFLLRAYAAGFFPMDHGRRARGRVRWYAPDPRAILPLDAPGIDSTLRRARRRPYDLRLDTAFDEVMRRCARWETAPAEVWISERFCAAYAALHARGYAHSFEAFEGDHLAAGLYGIAIGRAFMAESMFHDRPGAGSLVLAWSAAHLRDLGFTLYDIQMQSPHLERLGAIEITAAEYEARLRDALS